MARGCGIGKTPVAGPVSRSRGVKCALRGARDANVGLRIGSGLARVPIERAVQRRRLKVASSSNGNGNEEDSLNATNKGEKKKPSVNLKGVFQLPLEIASTLSKEDAHYLEKRGRKKWWRSMSFPKVPKDTLEAAHAQGVDLSLWLKVLPLGVIFFGASFNLAILQSLKDSIMVTTAGAETLPFLASFVVLPTSLGFFLMYGKMVETLPSKIVFYVAILPLVSFYVLFTMVLYPNHAALHPMWLVDTFSPWLPQGLIGLVKVFQYWTFSLFYCFAELWGSVVISVLFWSLANEVCTITEAKSVYPLMGIAANVALVLSGNFVKLVNSQIAVGNTYASLCWLVGGIVTMSSLMALAKSILDRCVIGDYCSLDPATASKPKIKKKGSFAESFAIIKESAKISNLAVLVISYGISHRLFEFAWKASLRVLYPTAQAYQTVLAEVAIATGWATITFMILGKFVFQYLGWGAAASATPVAMLTSGGVFFLLSLLSGYMSMSGNLIFGLEPATMAFMGVAAGAVTQVFARSSKFSLFDPAKEMVYIEMSKDEKSKGKAAVDLIGSQIGKSGGAWVTQALLLVTGSMTASLPIIASAFMLVIFSWLHAVRNLGSIIKKEEDEKVLISLDSADHDENDTVPASQGISTRPSSDTP
jgi:AAA family ATP:ADP antiporter